MAAKPLIDRVLWLRLQQPPALSGKVADLSGSKARKEKFGSAFNNVLSNAAAQLCG
jgi:hypothetical protein